MNLLILRQYFTYWILRKILIAYWITNPWPPIQALSCYWTMDSHKPGWWCDRDSVCVCVCVCRTGNIGFLSWWLRGVWAQCRLGRLYAVCIWSSISPPALYRQPRRQGQYTHGQKSGIFSYLPQPNTGRNNTHSDKSQASSRISPQPYTGRQKQYTLGQKPGIFSYLPPALYRETETIHTRTKVRHLLVSPPALYRETRTIHTRTKARHLLVSPPSLIQGEIHTRTKARHLLVSPPSLIQGDNTHSDKSQASSRISPQPYTETIHTQAKAKHLLIIIFILYSKICDKGTLKVSLHDRGTCSMLKVQFGSQQM